MDFRLKRILLQNLLNMKTILSSLLVFISIAVLAQSKWQVGVSFSNDLGYRTLYVDSSSSDLEGIKANSDEDAKMKYGFTTGINLIRSIGVFQLETALLFAQRGYIVREGELNFGNQIDARKGFIYPVQEGDNYFKFKDRYSFIDVPIKLNYLMGDKRLHYTVSVGCALNILLNAKSAFVMGKGAKKEKRVSDFDTEKMRKLTFSPQASLGLIYDIQENASIRLEPTFRYSFSRMFKNYPINQSLWNVGLNLSYLRSF